jgi:hypothetical protein
VARFWRSRPARHGDRCSADWDEGAGQSRASARCVEAATNEASGEFPSVGVTSLGIEMKERG